MEEIHFTSPKEPIAYLANDKLGLSIYVYSKMSLFKRFMMNWCFGFKYIKIE